VQLGHLEGSGVLPLGVPVALVKLDGMVVVPWDLITVLRASSTTRPYIRYATGTLQVLGLRMAI